MSYVFPITKPLLNIFINHENSFLHRSLMILAGVIIMAIASQLSIPLTPIPLTFQSATAVLIGMAYGPRYGSYVIMSYLFAGALGLPIFADFSGGFIHFFGPTAGYLLGFLPAAFVSGYLAQKGFAKNIFSAFFAACIGTTLLFAMGISFLATFIGWQNAISFGLMPFIISEPIKLIALACIIPKLWKSNQ